MTAAAPVPAGLDVARIRRDFPALDQQVHGRPLCYLDNAATTQMPRPVLDALVRFHERDRANIHRGVHLLSQRATEAYEAARDKARRFLGAADPREVVFVRGTTEAINLVAQSYGRPRLREGDEVLITHLEHHSNIVPWQIVCGQTGAKLVVAPITDAGEVEPAELARLVTGRTRIVSVAQVSNALGTVLPVAAIARLAHAAGAVVLVDGAQGAPHGGVDVRALGCDFYAFSGHKLYGPTGAGVLWGRAELLDAMPPYQGGGEMIRSVTFERTSYADIPARFEAGTPNIAGAIALGAAIDYLDGLGREAIAAHEADLLAYATARLSEVEGLRIVGTAARKAAVVSFDLAGAHPHDVGTILDREGIAVRTGHHCAQPTMARFGLVATTRASFALYNTREEIDRLVEGLEAVRRTLSRRRTPAPGAGDDRAVLAALDDLYREQILHHYRSPRNRGPVAGADRAGQGYNPLCGDRVTVRLRLEGDVVRDVGFEGGGCAISTASASMMTEAVKGRSRAEVEALFARFHGLLTGRAAGGAGAADLGKADLGKLKVFEGVGEFPVRVKCATLAWHTLRAAIEGRDERVSTEEAAP